MPASADNEEYLGSEKFEIKERDFSQPAWRPLIRRSTTRRRHRAFRDLRDVHFHGSDNPDVMAYSKTSDDGGDAVLVVVTLDPYAVRSDTAPRPGGPGLRPGRSFEVYDELSGETYTWGPAPYVRFDP